jgi:hypothetical protein
VWGQPNLKHFTYTGKQTSKLWVGFEHAVRVFERPITVQKYGYRLLLVAVQMLGVWMTCRGSFFSCWAGVSERWNTGRWEFNESIQWKDAIFQTKNDASCAYEWVDDIVVICFRYYIMVCLTLYDVLSDVITHFCHQNFWSVCWLFSLLPLFLNFYVISS